MVTRSKCSGLLKFVEERLLKKKTEEEERQAQLSYIPKDCISNILARLPADSLQRSRFVCKPWYNVVRNPKFINAHLQRSESVLIFLAPNVKKTLHPVSKKLKVGEKERSYPMPSALKETQNTVPVESKLFDPKCISIFLHPVLNSPNKSIQFIGFKNDKCDIGEYSLSCWGDDIRATCNGLILLDNKLKRGGVIVLNPVTKKVIALPVGTLHYRSADSYGFRMSDVTGEYKIVHLFMDELSYAHCEIFSLYKKTWRGVNGPSFGHFRHGFGYASVSAIGALHWFPSDWRDNIMSMEVDKEKFHQIVLPKSRGPHDRIIEILGSLGFVTQENMNHIDIWILKGLNEEGWTKQHSITMDTETHMVPLCSLRIKGDIIFHRKKDSSLYAYDFQQQQMTEIGKVNPSFRYLPHVNSIVTWMQTSEDMFD